MKNSFRFLILWFSNSWKFRALSSKNDSVRHSNVFQPVEEGVISFQNSLNHKQYCIFNKMFSFINFINIWFTIINVKSTTYRNIKKSKEKILIWNGCVDALFAVVAIIYLKLFIPHQKLSFHHSFICDCVRLTSALRLEEEV